MDRSRGRSVDAFGRDAGEVVEVMMGRRSGARGTYVFVCVLRCRRERMR